MFNSSHNCCNGKTSDVGADNIAQLQDFYKACTSFPGKKRATTATTTTTMLKTPKLRGQILFKILFNQAALEKSY